MGSSSSEIADKEFVTIFVELPHHMPSQIGHLKGFLQIHEQP